MMKVKWFMCLIGFHKWGEPSLFEGAPIGPCRCLRCGNLESAEWTFW